MRVHLRLRHDRVEPDAHPLARQARRAEVARPAHHDGLPILGVDVRVFDDDDDEVPWDGTTVGEIVARSNHVMIGYWNRPDETAEALRDGWLRTGDLAVVDPDGYLTIVDRKKDVIVSGGENIASVEVEKAIAAHPAVAEVAVVGVPDERWGEVPRAFVALKADVGVAAVRARDHRLGARAARALQGAEVRRLPRRAAPRRHRQDPEDTAPPAVSGSAFRRPGVSTYAHASSNCPGVAARSRKQDVRVEDPRRVEGVLDGAHRREFGVRCG